MPFKVSSRVTAVAGVLGGDTHTTPAGAKAVGPSRVPFTTSSPNLQRMCEPNVKFEPVSITRVCPPAGPLSTLTLKT